MFRLDPEPEKSRDSTVAPKFILHPQILTLTLNPKPSTLEPLNLFSTLKFSHLDPKSSTINRQNRNTLTR